jgi:predicted  nucleic acid-binding Zn-ribbon protein
VHADLQALLNLQEHDKVIMGIGAELAAFNPELEALDAELATARGALEAARRGSQEAGVRRAELEGKIESYRVMQERRRQRLEWVRGAKEASTLMAELDLARTVLAKEEAEWMRSADKVQEAERRVAEAEQGVEAVAAAQASRREAIAAAQAECNDRLAKAKREREAAAKGVNRARLQQYERIRRGRAPLALYPLHGEACGHCYTAVPLHRRQDVLHGHSVTTCEACGVIVYHAEA